MLTCPIPFSQFSNSQTSSSSQFSPTSPQIHISPDPQLTTGHYARFRVQYLMWTSDDHHQCAKVLLPLSMTCKAMWLRLRPWIWDLIEPSRRFHVMNYRVMYALRADVSLATSVRYLSALLCHWVKADSCSLEVHDDTQPVGLGCLWIHQIPRVPPEPSHFADRVRDPL